MISDRASHPNDHHDATPSTSKKQQATIMIKLRYAALAHRERAAWLSAMIWSQVCRTLR